MKRRPDKPGPVASKPLQKNLFPHENQSASRMKPKLRGRIAITADKGRSLPVLLAAGRQNVCTT